MTASIALDPSGTARASVAAPGTRAFPHELIEAARRADLADHDAAIAWEIAGLAVGVAEVERRALALIVLVVLAAEARGSTRVALDATGAPHVAEMLALLGATTAERRAATALLDVARGVAGDLARRASLVTVIGGPGAYVPLLLDRAHLYAQRMHALEARASGLLARRLQAELAVDDARVGRALEDLAERPTSSRGRVVTLDASQLGAVRAALTRPLTIVTGGPGTGKTAIVVSILRAVMRIGDVPLESIALAAPTGKAADRMRGSIAEALASIASPSSEDRALATAQLRARTLHSLLGQSARTGHFRHHARNPLAERLVIVDESSMIDLALFERLTSALDPSARLVLLGDADQLPSVEPGAVLRDLSVRLGERVVQLTQSHRMDPSSPLGHAILAVARRVNLGDAAGAFEPSPSSFGDPAIHIETRARTSAITFERVEHFPARDARPREAFFTRWRADRLLSLASFEESARREHHARADGFDEADQRSLRTLLSHFAQSRLLAVLRTGPRRTGVEQINAWFHARHVEQMRVERGEAPAIMPGEPVLVTRNDPTHGLYNGDTGVVVRVAFGTERSHRYGLVVARDETLVATPLDAVRPIVELAYATTVHKAQGSEHDCVALVLPDVDARPLGRELVYTAITRARRGVVIVGARDLFIRAATRATVRSSGLV